MSTTFALIDGPVTSVSHKCLCMDNGGDAWSKCPHCQGSGYLTYEEPVGGLNLANARAGALLAVLGFSAHEDLMGEIPAEQVAEVRRRVWRARNQPQRRAPHLSADEVIPPGSAGVSVIEQDDGTVRLQRMGPGWVSLGVTDEYLLRRLQEFDELLALAQDHGTGIRWA